MTEPTVLFEVALSSTDTCGGQPVSAIPNVFPFARMLRTSVAQFRQCKLKLGFSPFARMLRTSAEGMLKYMIERTF